MGLQAVVQVEALSLADYRTTISEARQRGIMGSGIYDSLQATFVREQVGSKVNSADAPESLQGNSPESRGPGLGCDRIFIL